VISTQQARPEGFRAIPVCTPVLDGREAPFVADCMETNWVSSLGEYIPRFEQAFARICDVPYGVACSSGTAAIHLALEALGIGPGDEVMIPSFTLIVSANMVCLTGATPVLVDVRPDTWCIDPALIEAKITPRTKAVMVVHMYGHPCDMDPILALAKRYRLAVIEDAAQAHGATYHGRVVGGIGHLGVFSFYANKIITTGEGGMLVTHDRAIADRAALLRNQAFEEERFVHHHVGFNYRMTNIQAAIGLAQCERFAEKIRRKREIAATYDGLLAGEDSLQTPARGDGCEPVYWMYGVVLKDSFGATKREVRDRLSAHGIETRSFFIPMHRQPVFQDGHRRWPDLRGHYPVSDMLGECGFYLPSGLDLTYDDQQWIAEQLLSCKR
jgi:perosamine synthetase